jgi:hypothetical protein
VTGSGKGTVGIEKLVMIRVGTYAEGFRVSYCRIRVLSNGASLAEMGGIQQGWPT